jgi:Holliday junction resolvase RusA-like endonuclease
VSGGVIRIEVPGAPVAKGRARLTTRGGFARAYTPAKTSRYEDLIRLAAGNAMSGRSPLEGALRVVVHAYVPMPKSMSLKKRVEAEAGILRPITRPDCDNYLKCALDGLNQIAFRDDAQVAELVGIKAYSEKPRLVVTIEELAHG